MILRDLVPSLLNQIKYFIILTVLRRSFNELAGPISASLRPGNTTFKMLQRWRSASFRVTVHAYNSNDNNIHNQTARTPSIQFWPTNLNL